jgi:hypothetical protein
MVGKSRTQNNILAVKGRGLKIMKPETNLCERMGGGNVK